MAKAYYSTMLAHPAPAVWAVVRDFGAYTLWVDEVDEAFVEDGRPGDAVGAVRSVLMGDLRIRQQLVEHSDIARRYSYIALEPLRFPQLRDFRGTLQVTQVVDGDRAFVEWWAEFDCPATEYDQWITCFPELFAGYLRSLRSRLATEPSAAR